MDTKNMTGKINEPKRWFLEKTNKIDKLLARLIKRKGEKVQINKNKMKKEKSQVSTQKCKESYETGL